MHRMLNLIRIALLAAAVALLPAWAHAAGFLIAVNTSAFVGADGFIDFQFNPLGGAPAATATVSSFGGSFVLSGAATVDGDVTGRLPGTVTFANTTGFNALLQPGTFDAGFSFQLDLDVPAASGPGSIFALGIYDAAFNPLLAADGNGFSLTFGIAAGGVTLANTAPASVAVTAVALIPEPATYALLLAAGLAALLAAARRRRSILS
jgi:hypothetical protein